MTTKENNSGMNWKRLALGAVVLIIIAGGGLTAFLLTGDDTASIAAGDAAATLEAENDTTGTVVTYSIESAGSEARFELGETLSGEEVTVVGTTNEVGGQIRIDFDNPSNSQVGEIVVNARTLATDRSMRDGAIDRFILETGEYEFIRFQPTQLGGLPTESVSVGETIEFQITGDLTIRDITNEVTFDVQATLGEDDIITGNASTTVTREAYDLTIPSVPNVADVDNEVTLAIEFLATEGNAEATSEPDA